jgi:hypothetical protein
MGNIAHTHKYYRIKVGVKKRIKYRCSLFGCVHHIEPSLALGRESICWICGEIFYLDKISLTLAKPHCKNCTKLSPNKQKILEMLTK